MDSASAAIVVRDATTADASAVAAVHRAAFPTPAEALLVERLHAAGKCVVSLVAARRDDGRVVGHVLFSRVTIDHAGADPDLTPRPATAGAIGLGLAPLAVLPGEQRCGTGGVLVRAGLERCSRLGGAFVVVLGSPRYYGRFGFTRASAYGLGNEYGADDAFQVVELRPGSLPRGGGLVRYATEFAGL